VGVTEVTSSSSPLSVVFFGSGPVAAQSLRLLSKNFTVEAIVTKPSTVKEMTEALPGVPIQTISSKRELDELVTNHPFISKLGILIDFGIIVSQSVIDAFELGIINSHFSVLPQWRGADPISFAILSGQKTTGVSLMLIDEGMDTGKVLVTKSVPISPEETTPSLTTKLIGLSDQLLADYVPRYISGEIQPRSQSHPDRATYSRKLTKEDGTIDWSKPAEVIEREIRAFIDWPKSRATLGGKDVIITRAHAAPSQPIDAKPGDLNVVPEVGEVGIVTGSGTLWIDELKPAGKKEMPTKAFLAGYGSLLK
jgi:methionyl-tRNA formyltransferase